MTECWSRFAPRSVMLRDPTVIAGWRLKTYEVNADIAGINWAEYSEGLTLAARVLPQPPTKSGRRGVGFIIAHPCQSHYYLIINWWDNQNELFSRVFVTERRAGAAWEPAGDRYSFCVWDIEIIWFERNLWIETMLSGRPPATERYLAEQLIRPVHTPDAATP